MHKATRPWITVVVPVRNGEHVITQQLDALARQTLTNSAFAVIVVNNDSTDLTRQRVAEWRDAHDLDLRIVDTAPEPGVNVARNAGIAQAHTEWVAICDADDIVNEGWLAGFKSVFDEGTHDLIGGNVVRGAPELAREFGGWSYGSDMPSLFTALGFLKWAYGANMAMRKAVWQEIGGFSAGWGIAGGDDVDFCWQAQLAGFSLGFAPDARITYQARSTLVAALRQKFIWAVATPKLYRKYKCAGARRRSSLGALRVWLKLLVQCGSLLKRGDHRDDYLKKLATNAGYLYGSVKFRVFYP